MPHSAPAVEMAFPLPYTYNAIKFGFWSCSQLLRSHFCLAPDIHPGKLDRFVEGLSDVLERRYISFSNTRCSKCNEHILHAHPDKSRSRLTHNPLLCLLKKSEKHDMTHKTLSQLSTGHQHCLLKVRITRIWDSINPFINNKRVMSVDFIAVDEQGTSMQGTMRTHDAIHIKCKLHEGRVYILANFSVIPARKNYRAVVNDRFLHLTTTTKVNELTDSIDSIPAHVFTLLEYSDLPKRAYNDENLTDVIGVLMKIGKIGTTYVREIATDRRNLIIQNASGEFLNVTLWGNHANEINHDEMLAEASPTVLMLSAMTVRQFKGEICINSTSASKCYIDLAIAEVENFRNKLLPVNYKVELLPEELPPVRPDEEKQQNRKTIQELLSLDALCYRDVKFTCEATFKDINCNQGWWYSACPICFLGVKIENGKTSCNNHGALNQLPVPWYKVDAVVEDTTSITNFMIFGRLAQQLLQLPAAILATQDDADRYILPKELKNLIGRTYIFQVTFNLRRGWTHDVTFKVTKVFNPNEDTVCCQIADKQTLPIDSPFKDQSISRGSCSKQVDKENFGSDEDILHTPISTHIQQELFHSEESLISTPPTFANVPTKVLETVPLSKKRLQKKELFSDRATKKIREDAHPI